MARKFKYPTAISIHHEIEGTNISNSMEILHKFDKMVHFSMSMISNVIGGHLRTQKCQEAINAVLCAIIFRRCDATCTAAHFCSDRCKLLEEHCDGGSAIKFKEHMVVIASTLKEEDNPMRTAIYEMASEFVKTKEDEVLLSRLFDHVLNTISDDAFLSCMGSKKWDAGENSHECFDPFTFKFRKINQDKYSNKKISSQNCGDEKLKKFEQRMNKYKNQKDIFATTEKNRIFSKLVTFIVSLVFVLVIFIIMIVSSIKYMA